jgi:hypothetical protein
MRKSKNNGDTKRGLSKDWFWRKQEKATNHTNDTNKNQKEQIVLFSIRVIRVIRGDSSLALDSRGRPLRMGW